MTARTTGGVGGLRPLERPLRRTRRVVEMVAAGVVAAALFGSPVSAAPTQVADIIVVDSEPESGLKVGDLAPGDTTEWAVVVRNVSGRSVPVSALFTTSLDDEGTLLTTDPVDGLHAGIVLCSQAWTPGESGPMNARTFTCDGTETTILGEVAVAHVVEDPFAVTRDLPIGGDLHIRVRIRFPQSAGNEFESLEGGLRIDFESSYADDPEIPDPTIPADPEEPTDPTIPGQPPVPNEPEVPGSPGVPGVPGQPEVPSQPGEPGKPPWRDVPLPRTGSDVLGLLAVGFAAITAGSILRAGAHRRRDKDLTLVEASPDAEPLPRDETGDGPNAGAPELE